MDLAVLLSLPRGVSPRLEWVPARALSSRAVAAVSRWLKTLFGVGAGTSEFLSSADMDLGVLLESPQGSQSSSRVGACTCAFLPSCSSSVTLPFT